MVPYILDFFPHGPTIHAGLASHDFQENEAGDRGLVINMNKLVIGFLELVYVE